MGVYHNLGKSKNIASFQKKPQSSSLALGNQTPERYQATKLFQHGEQYWIYRCATPSLLYHGMLTHQSGVGAMGYPMAMNVRKKLSKENTMYIYDVDQSACQRFKEEFESSSGAIQVASSPKDIAEKARTIVSILPSGAIVRDVYLNSETGIAAANSSESSNGSAARLYVECSTIDIETTRDVGEKLRELQMGHYVDAPVSARVRDFFAGCSIANVTYGRSGRRPRCRKRRSLIHARRPKASNVIRSIL